VGTTTEEGPAGKGRGGGERRRRPALKSVFSSRKDGRTGRAKNGQRYPGCGQAASWKCIAHGRTGGKKRETRETPGKSPDRKFRTRHPLRSRVNGGKTGPPCHRGGFPGRLKGAHGLVGSNARSQSDFPPASRRFEVKGGVAASTRIDHKQQQ